MRRDNIKVSPKTHIFQCSLLCLFIASCDQEEEKKKNNLFSNNTVNCPSSFVAKGSRMIGYDILDTTETGTFIDNLTQAQTMGMGFLNLHIYWNTIETAPSTFTDPNGTLASLESIANGYGIKLSLIISPIDIPARPVPADLSGTSFSSATMATRYNAMLDYVLGIVSPSNLISISVGNEIDYYDWTGNGDSPSDYGVFLAAVETHLDTHGVDMAFTATLKGLTSGTYRDLGTWKALAGVADVIHATY